jgi:D-aspartate ligase
VYCPNKFRLSVSSKPAVVILQLHDYPLHAGAIGIARSLGRLGIDIHLLSAQRATPLGRSRFVRSVTRLPRECKPDGQLAAWMTSVAPADRPVLVPIDDRGATFVQQQSAQLLDAYRFLRLPSGLAEKLIDKGQLSELAASAGVSSPWHTIPSTLEEVKVFLSSAEFPLVVKARDPERFERTSGIRSVEIAEDASQALSLWTRHLVDGVPNCLLQEYVPGGPETVWMVNAYISRRFDLIFGATGRKLRQFPPYTGATSLGICEHNEEVLRLTERLVTHINYRGILDIGWRFDARDGSYKLLDFNPRLGATFRLFVGMDETDVLRALYRDLCGEAIEKDAVSDGRKWCNEFYDVFSAGAYIRDGKLSPTAYLSSLRNISEGAWLALDDLRPGLATAFWYLPAAALRYAGRRACKALAQYVVRARR